MPQGALNHVARHQKQEGDAARAEAWDSPLDITGWTGQQAHMDAVAMAPTLGCALKEIGTHGISRPSHAMGL